MADGFEHTVRLQLRWRDMDMLGHLNQSVYHELLEEARIGLIFELLAQLGDDQSSGGFVLAHVELDHHTEVRKDHGEVEVVVRLAEVGQSSLRLEHDVKLADGTLAATGMTVLVAWDPVRRAKRSLTEPERAVLGGGA